MCNYRAAENYFDVTKVLFMVEGSPGVVRGRAYCVLGHTLPARICRPQRAQRLWIIRSICRIFRLTTKTLPHPTCTNNRGVPITTARDARVLLNTETGQNFYNATRSPKVITSRSKRTQALKHLSFSRVSISSVYI